MKRLCGLIALFIVLFPAINVFAESVDLDKTERIKLSKDLHDIRNIRDRINATILAVAEILPLEDREDFQKYVQLKIDYDGLEAKSVEYVSEVYSTGELKAMIAYFGSPDGQSAEAKGEQFSVKIGKDIMAQVDAAILAAKYEGVPESALPKLPPR